MRAICRTDDESRARVFSDYLFGKGIENEIEAGDDGTWVIWILSEDRVEEAKQLFAEYIEAPDSEDFIAARGAADRIKAEQRKKSKKSRARYVDVRTGWQRSMMPGRMPLTLVLIGVSVVVALLSRLGTSKDILDYLMITRVYEPPSGLSFYKLGLPEIMSGQVWRLFTPIFIHFGLLHILFNMLWLKDLGGLVEIVQGRLRLILLVLFIGALSNLGQYWVSGPNFGGMSGVVYGLLGYIWIRGRFDPGSGLRLDKRTVMFMTVWFFICLVGIIPHIANTAHGIGLGLGMAWGYLSSGRIRGLGKRM